jgi:hypothetical protein
LTWFCMNSIISSYLLFGINNSSNLRNHVLRRHANM